MGRAATSDESGVLHAIGSFAHSQRPATMTVLGACSALLQHADSCFFFFQYGKLHRMGAHSVTWDACSKCMEGAERAVAMCSLRADVVIWIPSGTSSERLSHQSFAIS